MKRNVPSKKQSTKPWYRCPRRGCGCKVIKCDYVESAILEAMREWLHDYTIKINSDGVPTDNSYQTALKLIQEQLASLLEQQDKICTFLEKGIYSVEMFSKRNDALGREIKKLQCDEADLLSRQSNAGQNDEVRKNIIPTTQHMLDIYDILNPEEKNRLWKIVLEKITVYKTKSDEFSLHIYPKVPR